MSVTMMRMHIGGQPNGAAVSMKPPRRPVPWIIWLAIVVHIAWGYALLVDPSIAPVVILVGLHWVLALGINAQVLGVLLIVAATLAAVGLVEDHRFSNRTALLMLMPQYALLLAAFFSDAQSVWTGYAGDREIDRLLLFTVLVTVMAMAVLHSAAIVERHLLWTRI